MDTTTRPTHQVRRRPRHGRALYTALLVLLLVLPMTAATAEGRTAEVGVWFTPTGSECDVLRRVERTVPMPRVATGALRHLLRGPTAAERSQGLTSMFSSDTAGMLRSVSIRDGVAFVDFADLREVIPNASSACGSAMLLSQLDATVTQFPTVLRARYSIDGSEAAFYEWLQRDPPARSTVTATRGGLDNTSPIHRDGDGPAVLREIRTGRHDGFDRVVFEFDGAVPSYWIRYTGVLRTDGGGVPVPLQGTAVLEVVVGGTTRQLEPPYDATYRGGRRYAPAQRVIRQVVGTGQYEGTTVFGVGLTGRSGFRVLELDGPPRLAIDVAHDVTRRLLDRGDRGPDVRDWQEQLNVVQHGYFAVSSTPLRRPLAVDSVFGPRTDRATRAFQRVEGIGVDGVVGPVTRQAMRQAIERASAIRP